MFVSLKRRSLHAHMTRCLPCTFHPRSVLTCTITSITNVAQATGTTKGSLSVNTVSIHMAIMAAIQIALVDI